ncbi:MAG: indolepyruvate oxidoreductase subunit beta [Methanobrevibacter wolinii]|uniref:indolepyruvate oxidoreductase subunit beta n=1 Tax=Methanobrevibacter wolinii TaxID=190977 RepID=UPI0005B2D122|nr:indolepyruvate oxidoreductase subunit beta [Methanobrevibacter wolinii]MDD5959195.1 indolepyruvate oxidoreductase subunit beta [Methanobrevibacter wolinii]
MSENNYSIYICGVGGQGIIKTSTIIGEAVMNEGYNVVMSEIHGMSQRGGSVSTELKIGDFKSSILENHTADMILGFEPSEVIRGLHKANKDTYLVFNTTPVVPAQLASSKQSYPNVDSMINALKQNFNNVHPVDGNNYAKEAGSILSLNMALLGSAVAVKSFPISKDLVIDAMKNNLKEKYHKMNIKAFELGYNAVKQ